MTRKIIVTSIILGLYILGSYVTIPTINIEGFTNIMRNDAIDSPLPLINFILGGNLYRVSIFSLSVSPYLISSIIMLILTNTNSYYRELSKSNNTLDIGKHTKKMALVIVLIQSITWTLYMSSNYTGLYNSTDSISLIITVSTLVVGTFILIFLAEQITIFGIGNGFSLIILIGILTQVLDKVYNELSMLSLYNLSFIVIYYSLLILGMIVFEYQNKTIWLLHYNSNTSIKMPIRYDLLGLLPLITSQIVSTFCWPYLYKILISLHFTVTIYVNFILYSIFQIFIIIIISNVVVYFFINPVTVTESILSSGAYIHNTGYKKEIEDYFFRVLDKLLWYNKLFLIIILISPGLCGLVLGIETSLSGLLIFLFVKLLFRLVNSISITYSYKKAIHTNII